MPNKLSVIFCVALLAATGCATSHDEGDGKTPAEVATLDRGILDAENRSAEDKAQDAGRKPLDVYEWLGIRPGMNVADVFCAGGYNTDLLSRVVGDSGQVESVFEFYSDKEIFNGNAYKVDELNARIEAAGLTNVVPRMTLAELEPGSIDVALIVRNYHDVEWVMPDLKRADVVKALFDAVKPDGIVGIVDVNTETEGWDQDAHRLNKAVVIEDFTNGGFELVGESAMLENPEDDHTTPGFEQGRFNLDRYLLKFKKPS